MDLIEHRVEAPRITRWGHALLLAGIEGGSWGVAIGALVQSKYLAQFVADNRNVASIRQTLLSIIVLSAIALPTLLLASCLLPHGAGRRLRLFENYTGLLAPICAVGFIPLLFQPVLWKDKTLGFLLTTAAFSVTATLSSRSAIGAAIRIAPPKWLNDIRAFGNALRARRARKVLLPLSLVIVISMAALSVVRAFAAAKSLQVVQTSEWAVLHSNTHSGGMSFWLSGAGLRASGHVSILGALYSVWLFIFPKSEGLFLLRLLAVTWPALPLYLWTRKAVGVAPALLLSLAYLSMPQRSILAAGDAFPVAFAVGLFFLSAYCFEIQRVVWALCIAVAAVSVNEQVALWYVAFGLYVTTRHQRSSLGALMALVALSYFSLMALVYLPGHGILTYAANPQGAVFAYGLGVPQSLIPSIVNSAYLVTRWLDTQSLEFWLVCLIPLGFMPLRNSRWFLWLFPVLLLSCVTTLGSDLQTAAMTHCTTVGIVGSVASLHEMKLRSEGPIGRNFSIFVGWVAAILPCVGMLGSLWLPNP